jgi:hypothetical protein
MRVPGICSGRQRLLHGFDQPVGQEWLIEKRKILGEFDVIRA